MRMMRTTLPADNDLFLVTKEGSTTASVGAFSFPFIAGDDGVGVGSGCTGGGSTVGDDGVAPYHVPVVALFVPLDNPVTAHRQPLDDHPRRLGAHDELVSKPRRILHKVSLAL